MSNDSNNWLVFLGHFHPLLVHLPIGGLVLLAFLELLASWTGQKDAAASRRWILGFVFLASLASAGFGWMLAQSGGYEATLLHRHRNLGFAVTVSCFVNLLLQRNPRRLRPYRVSLAATLALLVVASHLGGSITHGRDFLTRDAPAGLRALVGHSPAQSRTFRQFSTPNQQPLFAGTIQPILSEYCSSCHGAEKHKADLRLDSLEELMRGGQDGAVINAGHSRESVLIDRLWLPLEADGHMPPDGQPQPGANEIALLAWWIDSGASPTQTVSELRPGPEIQRMLAAVSKSSQLEK